MTLKSELKGKLAHSFHKGKAGFSLGPLTEVKRDVDFVVSVYVCKHCDSTHLAITLDDGPAQDTFLLDLTPDEAEALAKRLLNPPAGLDK